MNTQHKCKGIPKSVTVDYDPVFNWAILSEQGIIEVKYCPWCSKELTVPKHLVFHRNILDTDGETVYIKGMPYEIISETEHSYVLEGQRSFSRSQEGTLYHVEGGIQ